MVLTLLFSLFLSNYVGLLRSGRSLEALFFLSPLEGQTCEIEPKRTIIIKIMCSRSCDRNVNVMCAERNLDVIRSAPLL